MLKQDEHITTEPTDPSDRIPVSGHIPRPTKVLAASLGKFGHGWVSLDTPNQK